MSHETTTGIDNRKFAMWTIIASECMLFGTLIINYVISVDRVLPSDKLDIIKPADIINVPLTSLSTFVLLMSSLAMVLSHAAIMENNLPLFRKWCFGTAMLGLVFLGFQVFEFTEFYLEGLGLGSNLFGSSFYVLTGTHGAHVFVGCLILIALGIWSYRTEFTADHHGVIVETIGLYWHFVDVVWIIIFTLVYLFVLAP